MSWKAPFGEITKKTHSQQAIWWLNGFWKSGADKEAEKIYQMVQKFKELEFGDKIIEKKGKAKESAPEYKEGTEIDEFKAHRFLESQGETLTVVELRKRLETIDIDKNKRLALSEYLLFKYNKTPDALVKAPQGDNKSKVDAAEAQVEQVKAALTDVQHKLEAQKAALEQQKAEEAAAKEATERLTKAEEELRAAVEDLKKQEEDYKKKVSTLEGKIQDTSLSTVAKSKASAELAQLKAEDPLPLRKAKITQEAALRKVEKERKAAEAAKEKAEKARAESEAKQAELEVAEKDLQSKMSEAEAALEAVKAEGGVPLGQIWWLERELEEARKWMTPKKK
jgi:chromosome condensin MukBEF ATPase and DNA-binding subunit MukB